jgi:predicted transposase YdaD
MTAKSVVLIVMSFDNVCKLLAEKHPQSFATWLLGEAPAAVAVLKTELSIEPIRADSVTFLRTQSRILHLEFQVKLKTDPPLPLRMLDYFVRLYRSYRLPVTPILVLLSPPPEDTAIEDRFELENTYHRYRVVKLWEQDPALFLENPALLPLAVLTTTTDPIHLLNQVAQQVSKIESAEQSSISVYAQLLAGLRFEKDLIRQIFKGEGMQESVIYQDIIEEGEKKLLFRLLNRRIGTVPPEARSQIEGLPSERLEELGEAMLDFSEPADLLGWLQLHDKMS